MVFRKLERTWSHNNCCWYLERELKKAFPELKQLRSEELCDRFAEMNIDFYETVREKASPLIRLTLPFAIIVILLMIVGMPILFMIRGYWGFTLKDSSRLFNWFKALKLV